MTVEEALQLRAAAYEAQGRAMEEVRQALHGLEGAERRKGLRLANEAGIGATALAYMLGISRQRIYELLQD